MNTPFIPFEIVGEIALYAVDDVRSLRLVSKGFNAACMPAFGEFISRHKKLYATQASIAGFSALVAKSELVPYIRAVHIVGTTFREHPYGFAWVWEQMEHEHEFHACVSQDAGLVEEVARLHSEAVMREYPFVTSGAYRNALRGCFTGLKNLKEIRVQPQLRHGEHMPSWQGKDVLTRMSGWSDRYDTRTVFYGDWVYDEKHLAITLYEDEFGDMIPAEGLSFDDIGPQVNFMADFSAVYHGLNLPNEVRVTYIC